MRFTMTCATALLACAAVPHATTAREPEKAEASKAYVPKPYLDANAMPDPARYLPPPPAAGTPAYAADRQAYESALAGKGGRAWQRAIGQASVRSPEVQRQIMCALGAKVDLTPASALGRLMARSGLTLSAASERSKAIWKRDRPYVGEAGAVTCDPDANFGSQSPSYPSGHGAIGWMWGLMLAELAPDRSNELLAWGAELGDNRVACRVHYPSDIAAGRTMGAALLARLHGDAGFRADMEAARAEISAARQRGARPDCAADQAM